MTKSDKLFERQARAQRLVKAREDAGFSGPTEVSKKFGVKIDTYKAHEQGRNGFEIPDARIYAKGFAVSLLWLYFGDGNQFDSVDERPILTDVPIVSWVSAGEISETATVMPSDDLPILSTIDLPHGNWIALRVDGPSMNKISPSGSIIFVNLLDKRLVGNGCYVIADETGSATYKRYRPNEAPQYQPASYEDIAPPNLQGSIKVIGRVRRSVFEL